jgi:hypothetical protein
MRIFCTTILSLWAFVSIAQIERVPIVTLPDFNQNSRIQASLDTLDGLPFWEDFSSGSNTIDKNWVNSENVFVNNNLAVNPPTQYAATFDGINSKGAAYQESATFSGLGDELISQALDLSTVPNSKRNTVYFSFFWQLQGYGELPDRRDSLRLQFYRSDSVWVTQDLNPGSREPNLTGGEDELVTDSEGNPIFQQKILQIQDERYFHKGFRFRFQSFSNLSGIYDTWHIDYIYINQDRDAQDTFHFDRSLSGQQTSLFYPYREIPIEILRNHLTDFLNTPTGSASNLSDIFFPMEIDHEISNLLTGESITSGYQLKAQQSPQEFGRKFEGISIDGLALPGDSAIIRSTFRYKSGDKNLFEVVGSNNDTLFLPIDLRINDTLSQIYKLKNYFAYDDGTAEYAAGVNLIGGEVAVGFYSPDTTRLTDILIYFPSINPTSVGLSIDIKVWKELSEGSFSVRTQPVVIESPGVNKFQRIALSTPIVLSDSFYIGYKQYTNSYVGVGFDRNSPGGSEAIFSNTDGTWVKNNQLEGALMIRPVFNESDTVLSAGRTIDDHVLLYPNPTTDLLNISGHFEKLVIYDMFGKRCLSSGYTNQIDLNGFTPGIYLLRMIVEGEIRTKKIIVLAHE